MILLLLSLYLIAPCCATATPLLLRDASEEELIQLRDTQKRKKAEEHLYSLIKLGRHTGILPQSLLRPVSPQGVHYSPRKTDDRLLLRDASEEELAQLRDTQKRKKAEEHLYSLIKLGRHTEILPQPLLRRVSPQGEEEPRELRLFRQNGSDHDQPFLMTDAERIHKATSETSKNSETPSPLTLGNGLLAAGGGMATFMSVAAVYAHMYKGIPLEEISSPLTRFMVGFARARYNNIAKLFELSQEKREQSQ